jgi:ubiquinone/menaquinone biosynthesis C-methylase UbiE
VIDQSLDSSQAASVRQFEQQGELYGKDHILADTSDVASGLDGVSMPVGGTALDVATGGGHTALWLARHGWKVTAGDIAPKMVQIATKLCAEAGFSIETKRFAAEKMPFAAGAFDLVTVRVAPHHFSSPEHFIGEVARVLKPGGHFLLIDTCVPDDDGPTAEWLHHVEKLRDPSHRRYLSRAEVEAMARNAGLTVERSKIERFKQPDLKWYLETSGTKPSNREQILGAVGGAKPRVRAALQIRNEKGKIVWWWPRLTLLAVKK